MGIYDREYYRDERSSFLGTLNRQGQVWKSLVLANVVLFILQLMTAEHGISGPVTEWLDVDTQAILHGQVWRLLTGAFLHSSGWEHILFNMLALWWFGSEVEIVYGPKEFLAFYLTAAVVASAIFVGWDVTMGNGHAKAVGASGAVTAALVLFAMHFPNRLIYIFGFFPVPALVVVVLFVLWDAFGALGHRPGDNIAFAAHLGGAAFGFFYYKLHWRISTFVPTNWSFHLSRPRPRLKVYRGEPKLEERPEPVAAPRPARPSEPSLEAELDAVLAKVAQHGKSSLSEREHQILMRASEIYRNRRK
ncbi:MAG TPA: rhomboid family intramembrane serine protease [Gemmataceae bacterium]|jgi:membrane associated rhomboid family serine protease|nr:rhomboid family intramembrane serine protease [Gemmataceae bacterium]